MCALFVFSPIMLQFFLASWRAGFRSRALLGYFVFGLVLVAFAYLAASFSMRQLKTVTLDVGFSGLRFCLVFISITLVQDLVGREIERRSVVFSLAYPASRASYLLGRFFGVLALTATATLILGLLLWFATLVVGGEYEQEHRVAIGLPYWMTLSGIWLDACVVAAFTLLVSSIATVPLLPLAAGITFSVVGKAIGPVLAYVESGADRGEALARAYQPVLATAKWIVPDLSALDWRSWPMYGVAPDFVFIQASLLAALFYAAGLIGIAVWMFARREFN